MSEPATPTKSKAPVQDPNTPLMKRVYIGGLNNDVTAAELEDRFRPFGTVANVDVARNTVTGHCRGFAHITMNTTVSNWKRCVNIYNGTKWKGMELKIEDAKTDYRDRMSKEWEHQKEEESEGNKLPKKRKRVTSDGVLAKDMTLVTDKNMEGRKNWKRGRYGRAIALLHLRKDDGTSLVYDPTHYKNNLLKIYNLGVKMKPAQRLALYYEDFDKGGTGRDYTSDSSKDVGEDGRAMAKKSANDRRTSGETLIAPKPLARDVTVTKEMSNQQRLEALKKREEERQTEQKKISAALASLELGVHKKGHIKFSLNDETNEDVPAENGEETDDSDMRTWTQRTREEGPEKQALKTMFDSDDGDSDEREFDLEINPVFEGEAGRDRLNLQKRFGGDARFKLGEDFMDDDDDNEDPVIAQRILSSGATNDDVTKELTEEKSRAMDVLRSMFGEEKKMAIAEKPKQPAWSQATRFDPDAANAYAFLLSSDENSLENGQIANDELPESESNPLKKLVPTSTATSTIPEVSKEKHFDININLKPLFTPGAETGVFKLFGGGDGDDDEESEPEEVSTEKVVVPDIKTLKSVVLDRPRMQDTNLAQQHRPASSALFFFHFDEPSLLKRSLYKNDRMFMRTTTMEEITSTWESVRKDLTDEFKRKHKSASRKRTKSLRGRGKLGTST